MARSRVDFAQFGVTTETDVFIDSIVDIFNSTIRGQHTVDELLLHPREALAFCEAVRVKHHCPHVPDDAILRSLMRRRKNPEG